jgi:hypothetical protein
LENKWKNENGSGRHLHRRRIEDLAFQGSFSTPIL